MFILILITKKANTISPNKKMKIFPYPESCELACRFTRQSIKKFINPYIFK